MTLASKRRFWMRLAVVLGIALFVMLGLMAVLSLIGDRTQVHANLGPRFPGFWSDWGLVISLVIAAPFVAIAAWKNWNAPDE